MVRQVTKVNTNVHASLQVTQCVVNVRDAVVKKELQVLVAIR
jgi:hypothetical protein